MKNRNILLLVFIFIFSLFIIGCSKTNEENNNSNNNENNNNNQNVDEGGNNNDPLIINMFYVKEEDYPNQVSITYYYEDNSKDTLYLNTEEHLSEFFTNLNKIKYIEYDKIDKTNEIDIVYGDTTIKVYSNGFMIGDTIYCYYENDFSFIYAYTSSNTDDKLSESTGWLPFV